MPINIDYSKKKISKFDLNLVLFCNDKLNTGNIKKYLTDTELSYVTDLLKTADKKKNIFIFKINSKKNIILISIKNNLKISEVENLGAELYGILSNIKNNEFLILSDSVVGKTNNFLGHLLHGLKLKSYEFKKYKEKKTSKIIKLNIFGEKNIPSKQSQLKFKSLEEGTFTRDLVSEPGNVLHPDEYAKRLGNLKKDGLKINIFDEKKLKNLV